MLIRHSFEQGGLQTNKILEKYAPEGITVTKDIHYHTSDAEALLDAYYPKADTKPLGVTPPRQEQSSFAHSSGHILDARIS